MNIGRPIHNLALSQAHNYGCVKALRVQGEIVDTANKNQ